jgi:serine/threonine protein kinase, bacterial
MLINNRYRVIKTLGEGGFGQAYLAEDTQMPSGRRCVLKQLKPVATSPEVYQIVQERFQREAATLEKLGENNPQIPRLYAYFSENQKFYLVQEWIEGQTLADLIAAQGPQSESVVCSILQALLPVLDFIHSQGIIHRDIKPENIILRAGLPAAENQPVLIDFGAVRETMGTMVNSHNSLTSSIVIGTPGYMASEQAAGRPIPSSDLYSLGLVAIYLLTGLPPQSLESDPQTGEIIWRDKVGHVSMPLVSVIARSMRSHPRDRYSSANQMLAALAGSSLNTAQQVSTYQQSSGQSSGQTYPPNTQNQQTIAVNSAGPNTSVNTLYGQSASQKSLSPVKMGLIAAAVVASVIGGGVLISRSAGDSTLQQTASESGTKSDQPDKASDKDAVKGSGKDKAGKDKAGKDKESDATSTTPQSEGETASAPTEDVNLSSADDGEISAVPGGNVTPDNPDSSPGIAQYATLRQDLGLSQVNVYAVPDATTERLHYGLPGDRITLLDQTQTGGTTWNLVRFDSGAEGWIANSFLSVGAAETVIGAPQLDPETCTETYYQVNDPQDTSANLRKSPNGEVIVAIPNGTEVLFLGAEGSWTQVQLGSGQTGYISTQLLNESDCY